MPVQFGISVPNFAEYADPHALAVMAREAEQAGWDGFFVWDHLLFMPDLDVPVADPWLLLAAIALRTERVRLGPMVTPVARRRPWVLARQAVTLDHLSGGRLIFGVGLGHPAETEFEQFGEEGDARVRAAKLDEGLAILAGLWSGEPFSFSGTHYQLRETTFLPPPLQQPRIPVWVAGYWPRRAPFRRAAEWDGMIPGSANVAWDEMMPVDEVRAALDYIHAHRAGDRPFALAIAGSTGGDRERDVDLIGRYSEAGMTWWIEGPLGVPGAFDRLRERIGQGPPRPLSS
jgi:alkanesulfonate monooxygenase SsuD/methylene tetrahydromethanopterin reductase-like flavin-dependent oxidoreductase (luciferase family)